MSDEGVTRRCFLRDAGLAGACAALLPMLQACETSEIDDDPLPEEIPFDTNAEPYSGLRATGDIVGVESLNVLLVRDGRGELLAFRRKCTHAEQDLADGTDRSGKWDDASRQLTCRLHLSVFSETGEVLKGEAMATLTRYRVEYNPETGEGVIFGRQLVKEA